MDDADRADQEVEGNLIECLYRAQHLMTPALKPKGVCHYCGEAAAAPMLFCSADCSQDFQNEEDQLKRMGRR